MVLCDAGGGEVGVDVALRGVVGRHHVAASTLLMEAEKGAGPLRVVVVGDAHGDRGAHPGEAVDEDAEKGAIAQACECRDVHAVEQCPGLRGGEHRGLAGLDDMLRSPHGARGVEGQDLADDQPVEAHAQRCQVLLDARGGEPARELLDVGRDRDGLDLVQREAPALAPVGEAPRGRLVRKARVGVSDVGGEELPEAPSGVGRGGEEDRCRRAVGGQGRALGAFGGEEVGKRGGGAYVGTYVT